MNTEFIWPIKIYYEDTDAGGVVYYANYLKFYERARTEWLHQMQVNQVEMLNKDIAFAVTKAEVDYLKPAKLNDEVIVKSRILKVKAASIEFQQQLYLKDEHTNVLLNKAIIKVACVKLNTFSPCRIPANVKEKLQRILGLVLN
ncbi:Tol-Pal system-associated acyl-CoA thioesterase [hydrothermal vent metagenome]|uniref:Tol-Pal system-associated acyl-CoA thioesterase n=1 Tax=hydrothermal vent metagenome TaxID=652676 RepID=A0A3B0ZI61_9ZZZZ